MRGVSISNIAVSWGIGARAESMKSAIEKRIKPYLDKCLIPTLEAGRKHMTHACSKITLKTALLVAVITVSAVAVKKIINNDAHLLKPSSFLPVEVTTLLNHTSEATKSLWLTYKVSQALSYASSLCSFSICRIPISIPREYMDYVCLVVRDVIGRFRQQRVVDHMVDSLSQTNSTISEDNKTLAKLVDDDQNGLALLKESNQANSQSNTEVHNLCITSQENAARLVEVVHTSQSVVEQFKQVDGFLTRMLPLVESHGWVEDITRASELTVRVMEQEKALSTTEIRMCETAGQLQESSTRIFNAAQKLEEIIQARCAQNRQVEGQRARLKALQEAHSLNTHRGES